MMLIIVVSNVLYTLVLVPSGTRHLDTTNYTQTGILQNDLLQGGSKPFICPEKDIDKA